MVTVLLAVPAVGDARVPPKPRVHASDAAAMKAVTQYARGLERCRSRTLDYMRCDNSPPPSKGIRFEQTSYKDYAISARSRQGRNFRILRDGNPLVATCTPAGRGACPRSGRWKPKPLPVPTPRFGEEWLPHERELVRRFEALIAVIESCRARAGSLTACQDDPDVQAAARWDELIFPDGRFDLQLDQPAVAATARSSTQFRYEWLPDGTTDRSCQNPIGYTSPCVDGRW